MIAIEILPGLLDSILTPMVKCFIFIQFFNPHDKRNELVKRIELNSSCDRILGKKQLSAEKQRGRNENPKQQMSIEFLCKDMSNRILK